MKAQRSYQDLLITASAHPSAGLMVSKTLSGLCVTPIFASKIWPLY